MKIELEICIQNSWGPPSHLNAKFPQIFENHFHWANNNDY